ncbi:MAG TPA: ATP-dependent Clp protease ATP-binding subunit [Candidatus Saccharibacteria bacterium]|nr:ATP-dependent Clp protease ATP-binding subunit [Candidatus Saccharibacteria bacterium]
MAVELQYKSERAHKARLAATLDGFMVRLLTVSTVAIVIVGIVVVALGVSLGWLLVGLAAIPAIVVEWYNGELKRLKPENKQSIDASLEGILLGKLPKNPSPKDIAIAVGSIQSGLFYGVRFGLTPNLLSDIASPDQGDTARVWEQAVELKEELGKQEITTGMVIYALCKQFPQAEALLAHLHLSFDDIIAGIHWQDHLRELSRHHSAPRRTGGIARDWSFGFIPLLARFGQNISEQISRGGLLTVDLDAHADALDQLIETFSNRGRQNAVLVGPMGVGKTTIVHAFAERLLDASSKLPSELKFRQVIVLDSASLIAAASGRGELEDLVMRVLGEAFAAKNIIICLDDAQLFFEEGIGSVDIANVLQPILEAGRLRVILTMDEQRFLQISRRNPNLANALNRINVQQASKAETMRVMQDQLLVSEFQKHVTYTYQALEEAYRLSERYVHDLAMPGRALKLLQSAASYDEQGLVTMNSVQKAIEQTMNVKIAVASDRDDREKLLNLEELIHKRMVNQTRAVGVVSDALRRARAGVRNQNRPIGTFLFLGPTGVGKTELAKALADVYFDGEDRIVRLDLNEFVQSSDVRRLIADGAEDPSSLTAQMMKQPFSVVLLDEIEKAHPQVLTTLLQMLDEGILRDEKNREISFRDAIVIATSNAGADRIREYITRGHDMEHYEQEFIDELISSGQFKPEFINRFDEIVTFVPLGKQELLQVVDLMIAGVNKTLALQKVSVSVDDDAKMMLVEKGYDPRLGARPMRRVIQRVIENNVAKAMLAGMVAPGTTIKITGAQVQSSMGSEPTSPADDENIT